MTAVFELDDDPKRIQLASITNWLTSHAYWARWRTDADIGAQVSGAWRVVGAYSTATGELIGFARAVSDGVAFAYLADVFVVDEFRGHGIGKALINRMIDEGPGSDFRWTLFTSDAHGLYEQYGFVAPDSTAMVRPAARPAIG